MICVISRRVSRRAVQGLTHVDSLQLFRYRAEWNKLIRPPYLTVWMFCFLCAYKNRGNFVNLSDLESIIQRIILIHKTWVIHHHHVSCKWRPMEIFLGGNFYRDFGNSNQKLYITSACLKMTGAKLFENKKIKYKTRTMKHLSIKYYYFSSSSIFDCVLEENHPARD